MRKGGQLFSEPALRERELHRKADDCPFLARRRTDAHMPAMTGSSLVACIPVTYDNSCIQIASFATDNRLALVDKFVNK